MQRRPSCERRALAALVVGFLTVVLPASPAPGDLASRLVGTGANESPLAGEAADGTSLGSLSNSGGRISWSRTIEGGETQVFSFDVSLPADQWPRPGGVCVGVLWPGTQSTFFDHDMDLEVFSPDGTPAATSPGGASDTESVRLPGPANGTYRIEVSSDTTVSYQGLVMVQHDYPGAPRDLLPDVSTLAPDRVQFDQVTLGTCNIQEQDQLPRRCLRFDLAYANFGEGPLEVRIANGVDPSTGQVLATQRVYRSDGTFHDVPAGTLNFHAFHGHFHFENASVAELWNADGAGNRVGTQPVRTGSKSGFGFADVLNPSFGQRDTGAKTYTGTRDEQVQHQRIGGISAGWVDVYPEDTNGNYIEVSGVPDGAYVLRIVFDPDNKLAEEDETNNAVCLPVSIGPGDTAAKTGAPYAC
jgi:hypothetical protein